MMNRNVCILALLWLLISATAASTEVRNPTEPGGSHSFEGGLMARLYSSSEPLPVIVRLRTAATPKVRSDGDVEGLQLHVSTVLKPFLGSVAESPGISTIRPFLLQPAFAAKITQQGFQELISQSTALQIEIDDRWDLHTAEGMHLIQAESLQAFGFAGRGFAVGIIDTGIDPFHPTLGGGNIPNAKVVRGLDTADDDDDPSDCSGHGTAVASIAAGLSYQWSPDRNFAGGVAPAAKVLAYKAAPDSNCSVLIESAVIAAIEDAILHNNNGDYTIAALNVSGGAGAWDGPCDNAHPAMATAVEQAAEFGIAVVASTGNNGLANGVAAPACLQGVLAVGSVWDQDASDLGSLFCLDFQCQNVCSDGSKMTSEVTCYTNSGTMLDLLAPSEYLKVAEAEGLTTSFGGTSGAAPYLTGAIAMIRRAYPDMPVGNLRTLLGATGELVTEPRSGLSRPLIKLINSLDTNAVSLAEETRTAIPPAGQEPLRSPLLVSQSGPIGGIRVWLRLTHPGPSLPKVDLVSPEGIETTLHGPGSSSYGAGGLFGTYPIDLIPQGNLDEFIGAERHGSWELVVENLSGTDATHGMLESWGLVVADLEPLGSSPDSGTLHLPIAARGPGVAGTQWTTNLRIFNPSVSTPADLRLYLVEEGVSGLDSSIQRPLFVPAGHTVELEDVIGSVFSLESGAGQILLKSENLPLVVTSRISTTASDGGSYGQFVPSQSNSASSTSILQQLAGGPGYRTNVGFSELQGQQASVTLTLYDAQSGETLGSPVEIDVEPHSVTRLQRVVDRFQPPSHRAYGIVHTQGSVASWASVVDEGTGDAVFVPGATLELRPSMMIPVVARNPGIGGTLWRSDVHLLSLGSRQTDLTLEFRASADPPGVFHSATINLEAGRAATLDDILDGVFSITEGTGSLRIVNNSATTPLVVGSRTFNSTAAGTYGQSIDAVGEGFSGPSVIVNVDGSAGARSNLVLCEVSGNSFWVEIALFDKDAEKLGSSLTVQLQAFRMLQINNVFEAFGVAPRANCRLNLKPLTGAGRYTGLVSRIDQKTGDAVAIRAIATP